MLKCLLTLLIVSSSLMLKAYQDPYEAKTKRGAERARRHNRRGGYEYPRERQEDERPRDMEAGEAGEAR